MTSIPSQYSGIISQAAKNSGLPESVVVAQINLESGFNPGAVSPAGAEGMAQFLPSTWSGLGCKGSEFNANDAMQCYATYMSQLLRQEGGSVYKALEAYNAGPGNLSAGSGYASQILSAAGQKTSIQASGGAGGSSGGGSGSTCAGVTVFGHCIGMTVPNLGADIQDWLERGALIVFGAIFIIIGVIKLVEAKPNISMPGGSAGEEAAEVAAA